MNHNRLYPYPVSRGQEPDLYTSVSHFTVVAICERPNLYLLKCSQACI